MTHIPEKVSSLIPDKLPEFIKADYQKFASFVKAYYSFLEQFGNPRSAIRGHLQYRDIDGTIDSFLEYFKKQYAINFPENALVDKRLLYKNIKDLYATKGTEAGLALLFRTIFNEDVVISYPSDNILRASDGKWIQDSFVTVKKFYGEMPVDPTEFFIRYEFSDYQVAITKIESVGLDEHRIYYRPSTNINLEFDQIIVFKDHSGNTIYAGKTIDSPSYIAINNGGSNWQLGQVIRIPGTHKDTIARVSMLGENGSIKRIEILEYGFSHTQNETIIVSPYPNKPIGSTYDIVSEITSLSPLKYHHTLTAYDYLDGVTDRVTGVSSGINQESYFLEDYSSESYVGYPVFDNYYTSIDYDGNINTDITMEQWLASRATLVLHYDTQVKTKGRWLNGNGQISNQDIRIQDNFYYQQFSYEVKVPIDRSKYENVAKIVHPAGTKMFSSYSIGETLEITPTAITSFPFITQDLLDSVAPIDSQVKLISKAISDSVSISDFDKQIITKRLEETLSATDANKESVTKRISEILSTSDITTFDLIKDLSETVPILETVLKEYNKYITDTVTASSPDTFEYEIIVYNEEEYFGENYVQINKILTLGV